MKQTLTSPDGTPASRLAFDTMQFRGTGRLSDDNRYGQEVTYLAATDRTEEQA